MAVSFTISNISPVSVTYQNLTILAGNDYTPPVDRLSSFSSDPGLIADLLAGKILISSSTSQVGNKEALPILEAFNGSAQYNVTRPTLTDGQLVTPQVDNQGRTLVGSIAQPLPAGSNVLGGVTQSGTWNINNVSGTVSLPTGAATSAIQTAQSALIGDVTEAAPATDTASSGLNGRLQRIAQRLTSIFTALSDGTQQSRLRGATDGTLIGNTSDSLKTVVTSGTITTTTVELPTFSIVAQSVQVGNNKSLLSIQNTSTSLIKIREIWLINDRTSAVTGVAGEFQFKRITSFTGGTSLTSVSYDTADTLPAGITLATGATVSGEDTFPLRVGTWSTDEWGPGTLDQEGLDHGLQQIEPFWKQTVNGKAIVLRQNQGAHLKFATNSTAGFFNVRLIFTVE